MTAPQPGLAERVEQRLHAWDDMHRAYFAGYDARWAEVIRVVREHHAARRGAPARPLRILDLGCGPGTLTRRIASAFPEALVVGIDADPVLVGLARRSVTLRVAGADPRHLAGHCTFVNDTVADTVVDPVPESLRRRGPFDVIVSSAFIHYFDDAGLDRLHALCRALAAPGGVLVTAEQFAAANVSPAPSQPSVPAQPVEVARAESPWGQWWRHTRADAALVAFALAAVPEPGRPVSGNQGGDVSRTAAEYRAALVRAGFAVTRCSDRDDVIAATLGPR